MGVSHASPGVFGARFWLFAAARNTFRMNHRQKFAFHVWQWWVFFIIHPYCRCAWCWYDIFCHFHKFGYMNPSLPVAISLWKVLNNITGWFLSFLLLSVRKPFNQSCNYTFNQSVNCSASHLINQPELQSVKQPVNYTSEYLYLVTALRPCWLNCLSLGECAGGKCEMAIVKMSCFPPLRLYSNHLSLSILSHISPKGEH